MTDYLEYDDHRQRYLAIPKDKDADPPNYIRGTDFKLKVMTCRGTRAPLILAKNETQAALLRCQAILNLLAEKISSFSETGQLPNVWIVRYAMLSMIKQAMIEDGIMRFIFCDTERPTSWPLKDLLDLEHMFQHFKIPSCFLQEKMFSLTHAFGVKEYAYPGTYDFWFRLLSKTIEFENPENPTRFPMGSQLEPGADSNWIKASFYMQWDRSKNNITFICFNVNDYGPNWELIQRLGHFASKRSNVEDALRDPYIILLPVLNHFFELIANIHWDVLRVFEGASESAIFKYAATRTYTVARELDFTYLHNISKHVLHLREGLDALMDAMRMIRMHHNDLSSSISASQLPSSTPALLMKEMERGLMYQEGLFEGLRIRLRSVETRVANVISLAFNLVTEQDSFSMQQDSASMNTIAIVTLIFLPGTAVASVFGSQFLNFNPDNMHDGKGGLSLSPRSWIFLITALPITAITIGAWIWALRRSSKEMQRRRRDRTMLAC